MIAYKPTGFFLFFALLYKQARRQDSVTEGAEINLGGHEKFIYANSTGTRGHEKFIPVWIK